MYIYIYIERERERERQRELFKVRPWSLRCSECISASLPEQPQIYKYIYIHLYIYIYMCPSCPLVWMHQKGPF